jgi:sigma 54 modulation/S30EA-like ribosomal protein
VREGPLLQITLHGIGAHPVVERVLRRQLAWLRRCHPYLTGCRVTVEAPHRHHRQGCLYRVRVEVTTPGRDRTAIHIPSLDHAHEDLRAAIRDAFESARRELMNDVIPHSSRPPDSQRERRRRRA